MLQAHRAQHLKLTEHNAVSSTEEYAANQISIGLFVWRLRWPPPQLPAPPPAAPPACRPLRPSQWHAPGQPEISRAQCPRPPACGLSFSVPPGACGKLFHNERTQPHTSVLHSSAWAAPGAHLLNAHALQRHALIRVGRRLLSAGAIAQLTVVRLAPAHWHSCFAPLPCQGRKDCGKRSMPYMSRGAAAGAPAAGRTR